MSSFATQDAASHPDEGSWNKPGVFHSTTTTRTDAAVESIPVVVVQNKTAQDEKEIDAQRAVCGQLRRKRIGEKVW